LTDLLDIAAYVRERNRSAANDVETAIRSTIDLLVDFPKIGRDRPEFNARALGIPRYPPTPHITASRTMRFGSYIFATTGEDHPSAAISEA